MDQLKYVGGKLCKPIFVKYKKNKDGSITYPKKAKALVIWIPVDEVS